MTITTRGIVLHTLRYGEDGMIVDIFTESQGAIGFYVKIPRSRRSPVRTLLLCPLSILELSYDYKPSQHLQRIQEMNVLYPYQTLPYDPMKETLALFLGEFLYHSLKNEDENYPLFLYLMNGLQWLDSTEKGVANFHLTFLIRMTRFLGFWPGMDDYEPDAVYDLQGAHYTRTLPPHGHFLRPGEASMVPLFMRMDFPTMHLFRMNRQQRNRFLEVLTDYYRLHVPEFPELKSIDILREVLS